MQEAQNNTTNVPQHVAIIMDGNRRWAVDKGLSYTDGHKEALKRIEELIEYSAKMGIKYMTLWAWSPKNWKRSKDFIDDIIALFRLQLSDDGLFARATKKGAKLHHIGSWAGFPDDIRQKAIARISGEPGKKLIDVNIAVGYEGRGEIVDAVKDIIKEGIPASEITTETISSHLYTKGQPSVDLMIRTGGDMRTSGYLIWQIADAEFYFTDTYMPDFGPAQLEKALLDYSGRERRMGGDSKKY
ncbi:di-trans,poly-cis-decaprenylcistransferase [candidate division WWE3 bacterium CG_4_9_14_0_2_um_filter_35_11]|uniref:Isoprenyl transferase n=1 Tax=candidate division WWE3 bacterium CG_4_9_14_0_2_um_filter_35_11 TaxID=1975077 RepID=A0A2M8ELM2_UNCKA|nr:MAG: di-trans,poly-cis-decaprenylcistransferase [candidate division WWE3 bacterium CG10_big_fil_rev_8_21_14_0_10_35_32]PJC23628.1 MAG: di-trans,poly-cis-decaprenylcistransferase [candidate division WWE3 bacterium CG_4_9_14_0_2_um_filter_35_11]